MPSASIRSGRARRPTAPVIGLLLPLACCAPPSGRPAAFIANSGANHIQVIDLESGQTLRRIHAGAGPWRLVPSPDGGSLWAQHWTAGSTAVIDLASLRVRALHAYRGPGIFSADGARFWTFSWPDYALTALDPADGRVLSRSVTEIGRVAGLARAPEHGGLFLFQQDLLSPFDGPRYSYVLRFEPAEGQDKPPKSLQTGPQPEHLLAPPGQPFLLTADRGTDGITILNNLGDRRSLRVCEAPRRLALSPDGTMLAVGCWRAESGPASEIVLLESDFSARPWPVIREKTRTAFTGGLADLDFSSDNLSLYGLDEVFDRLIEWDLPGLAQRREIETGSQPRDLVLAALHIPATASDSAEPPDEPAEVLRLTRSWGAPFDTLAWTETVRWRETSQEEDAPPEPAWSSSQFLQGSGAFRSQSPAGVRIAGDGWTYSIREDGQFWRTPRQELLARVLALQSLPPPEAVRLLAGDLPRGPFPSEGIAVDVHCSRETSQGRVLIWGASSPDQAVSQLWLDAATGAPLRLIERFGEPSGTGHGTAAPPPTIETRFLEWQTLPGGAKLPLRLERVIGGAGIQDVLFEDARTENQPDGFFDLARLGGAKPAPGLLPSDAEGKPSDAVMEGGYLPNPWVPHAPYTTNPPTSGPRLHDLARWGAHTAPVPLGLQVHNLEHGAALVQYNCEQPCPELVKRLENLTRLGRPVVVAPYPYSNARITVTAWGRVLSLDDWDQERITHFILEQSGSDHHGLP